MKHSFLILLAGVIGIVAILYFRPKPSVVNEQAATPQPMQTNIAPVSVVKNPPIETISQTPPTIIVPTEPKEPLDAIKMQSLSDWTNAIPKIKQWSSFRGRSSWVAASRNTNDYPIILLTGINGSKIQFTASLTSVSAMEDHVQEIELHTPDMNIDEAREFGESLLQMMSKDKTSFNAWCDKVGNNWVDAPLYSSDSSQVPDSGKFYNFQMLRSYGNEKPWVINFIISDR